MTNHPRRAGRRKHQRQAERMIHGYPHGYPHGKHRPATCPTCRWITPTLFPFEHRRALDIAHLVNDVRIGNRVLQPTRLLIGPAQ